MELINFKEGFKFNDPIVAAIGEFDGFHLGHQSLIKKTESIALLKNYKSCVITFSPHPAKLFNPSLTNYLISTPLEKFEYLKQFSSIDYLLVIEFNDTFANLEPDDFISNYLINIGIKEVVVGFDFKFGKSGLGSAKTIESYNNGLLPTHIIEEVKYESNKLSSSLIRDTLINNDFEKVLKLLNHPFILKRNVIHGDGIGTKIGFPTLNLDIDNDFIGLPKGVYIVKVLIDNIEHYGIMNVGNNPTLNYNENLKYEVHIIDYSGDLYNKLITIMVYKYLRNEVKYAITDDLINQIKLDKIECLNYFKINKKK